MVVHNEDIAVSNAEAFLSTSEDFSFYVNRTLLKYFKRKQIAQTGLRIIGNVDPKEVTRK